MSFLDGLTAVTLAFIGVRIAGGTRIALTGAGRQRVGQIVRGLRPRHFVATLVVLPVVATLVLVLASLPVLSFGWWTALGGLGNPVTGGTERTTGTPLEWLIPLVFLLLLLPPLPLFAEAEERMFRLGSEHRSAGARVAKAIQFGLVHAVVGIPIGAALALSAGGGYFTWAYLQGYRRSGDARLAMLESTCAHLAYNVVVLLIVVPVLVLG